MLIEYHRNMLADKTRNDAFRRALAKVIKKGKSVVADIGSGTGIMGFLAARLGAKEVHMFEHADVMGLAEELARKNRIKNVHFFHDHSTNIIDPPQADIVISETLGNYAFEEQIIETLSDARRFLKPGGTIIPQRIRHFVCPVVGDRFFSELTIWDKVGYGLDFSPAQAMSLNNVYVRTFKKADLLDSGRAAKAWDDVDLRRENNNSTRRGHAEWKLSKNTAVYGFAVWWTCELVPGVELSTHPLAPKTHWEQLYFPVLKPIESKKGDTVSISISSAWTPENGTVIGWKIGFKPRAKGRKVTQYLDLTKGYLG